MSKRYEELDSLRGLAAITVMLYHMVSMTTLFFAKPSIFMYSPLQVLVEGHQAVMLFFVLSGFVLSLPYLKNQQGRYSSYVVRRICRIYIPYMMAVTFGFFMREVATRGGIPSQWHVWSVPITLNSILNHLLLIGTFNQDAFDPVIWSLVHEMRISLIFPLLMVLIKASSRGSLLFAGGMWCIGLMLHCFFHNVDIFTNYLDTFEYIFMFTFGALLAKNTVLLSRRFTSLSNSKKTMTVAFGFLLYTYSTSIYHLWDIVLQKILVPISSERFIASFSTYGGNYLSDLLTTIGASVGVVFALSNTMAGKILRSKILRFFGKISYSLYLYHMVILLSLTLLLSHLAPLWALWLSTVALSVGMASLSYIAIETPAMRLGRRLTRSMNLAAATTNEVESGTKTSIQS